MGSEIEHYLDKGYTLLNTTNKLLYKQIKHKYIIYFSEDRDVEPHITKLSLSDLKKDIYEINKLPKKEKSNLLMEDKINKILLKHNLKIKKIEKNSLTISYKTGSVAVDTIIFSERVPEFQIKTTGIGSYWYSQKTIKKLGNLFKKNKYSFLENSEEEGCSC